MHGQCSIFCGAIAPHATATHRAVQLLCSVFRDEYHGLTMLFPVAVATDAYHGIRLHATSSFWVQHAHRGLTAGNHCSIFSVDQ